ncbi:hypothetical protein RvY_16106 [Ramazzottius varieornatus]|uniref:Tc1-like transposase DDE domain-containing protein n=1 Tax=Ramazzottius varieornatus TaxID=947166 RepID=A0A1D1VXA1_RAMVA|nr:hypothetical protein RvY_16106 [Ramazzottius varieornatus]
MRVICALDMLKKLEKDKYYLNYVVLSDEASAKFDYGRHTVLLAKKVMPKIFEIKERRKKKKRVIRMHNNAPSHKGKLVQAYLKKSTLSVLPWPPLSPDMNPIENG